MEVTDNKVRNKHIITSKRIVMKLINYLSNNEKKCDNGERRGPRRSDDNEMKPPIATDNGN